MFRYHKKLPPKIWDDKYKMNPLVAQSLMMIASECVRYLDDVIKLPIGQIDICDALVHGSITNYYWDRYSDIDLCIVADLGRIRNKFSGLDTNLLLKSLIRSWRRNFDISIFGRGVDISLVDIQDGYDANHKKVGSSYSLRRNEWLCCPEKISCEQMRIIRNVARQRYRVIMRQCKYLLRHQMSSEYIDTYLVNLQRQRQKSMGKHYVQPVTSMTMAFKMVRNTGVLRKLRRLSRILRSKKYHLV